MFPESCSIDLLAYKSSGNKTTPMACQGNNPLPKKTPHKRKEKKNKQTNKKQNTHTHTQKSPQKIEEKKIGSPEEYLDSSNHLNS